MNVVLSTNEIKWVRKKLNNYKKSCIINFPEIKKSLGYNEYEKIEDLTHNYIINSEIEKLLKKAINSKRINQIVYFHSDLNNEFIENIKNFFYSYGIENINLILLDKNESNVSVWSKFDRILSS